MPPPPNQPTGAPVPTTPQVPVIGQQQAAQQKRKTANELRQQELQRLADSKNEIFRRVYYKTLRPGAVAVFNYLYWKHDPYPLLLCSGIYSSNGNVAGINLHYLTFKYMRYLIQQYCSKAFSYPLIKNNLFIKNAFRTYKREGLRTIKMLDCGFLATVLGTVRSFKPEEVEKIRQEIQRQLRARMNPKVEEMMEEYVSSLVPDPFHQRYREVEGYEGLERYGEPEWPRTQPPLKGPKPTIEDLRRLPQGTLPVPPG